MKKNVDRPDVECKLCDWSGPYYDLPSHMDEHREHPVVESRIDKLARRVEALEEQLAALAENKGTC